MKDFIQIAKKSYKWIIFFYVLSLFVACPATLVMDRYTRPVYEAKVILQIISDENIYENYIDGEQLLLSSKSFIKNGLSNLNFEISYYVMRKFLNDELYDISPFSVETRNVNPLIYNKPILISFTDTNRIHTTYIINEQEYTQVIDINSWTNLTHTEIRITLNDLEIIPNEQHQFNLDFFFTINDPDYIISQICQKIEVEILDRTAKTIQISIREYKPKKASDIVNAIADEFINKNAEDSIKYSNSRDRFVSNHLILEKSIPSTTPVPVNAAKKAFKICFIVATLLSILLLLIRYFKMRTSNYKKMVG